MIQAAFTTNADTIIAFCRMTRSRLQAGMGNPDLLKGAKDAQTEYLAAMRARFGSEANGQWRQLSPYTRQERKRLGFSPAHPILRRLGYLYSALIPGADGNVFAQLPDGIRAGYGGGFRHPGYIGPHGGRVGGNVRLADIAAKHQFGSGRVPARPILIPPDGPTADAMRGRITDGVRALIYRAAADAAPKL